MKKLFLAGAAVVAITSGTQAADLGVPRGPVAAAVMAPVFNWSGFYLGAQIGYYHQSHTQTLFPTGGADYVTQGASFGGLTGGVHVGFNYQINQAVLGLEADLDFAGGRRVTALGAPFIPATDTLTHRYGTHGSIRGRLGYAVDRALFYVTGGLAIAQFNHQYFAPGFFQNVNSTRLGATVGAGVEYAFTPNWTARVEYRYTDYFRRTNNLDVFLLPPGGSRVRITDHAIRLGVSYLFSSGSSAVVARY
jgi:outer membrane immunogenic protein